MIVLAILFAESPRHNVHKLYIFRLAKINYKKEEPVWGAGTFSGLGPLMVYFSNDVIPYITFNNFAFVCLLVVVSSVEVFRGGVR